MTKRLYLVTILSLLIILVTSSLVVTRILTELLTEDASKNYPKDCQFVLNGKVIKDKNEIVIADGPIIMGGLDNSRNFWFHVSKPEAGLEVDVKHDHYCHFTYGQYLVTIYRRGDNRLVLQRNIRIEARAKKGGDD